MRVLSTLARRFARTSSHKWGRTCNRLHEAHLRKEQRGPVGGWLWEVRGELLGLSKAQVAHHFGVNESTITRTEQPKAVPDRQREVAKYYQGLARERGIVLPAMPPIEGDAAESGESDGLAALTAAINGLVKELALTRQEQARWNAGVERVVETLATRVLGQPIGRPELPLPEVVER